MHRPRGTSRMILRRGLSSWSDHSVSVCPQLHLHLPPPQRKSPELGPSLLRPCGSLPDEACSATTPHCRPSCTKGSGTAPTASRPSTKARQLLITQAPRLPGITVLVCCSLPHTCLLRYYAAISSHKCDRPHPCPAFGALAPSRIPRIPTPAAVNHYPRPAG